MDLFHCCSHHHHSPQLLGFPIQLIGLLAVPYLAIRYLADGGDVGKDVGTYTSTIIKKLPGACM
jgi:hypothetical protein